MDVTPIGLDPGFGNTKAAMVGLDGLQVTIVPSIVGVGDTELGLLSLGNLGRRSRTHEPDSVAFGGITYLVGENVARFARPVERMDFLRLSDGPELRALFYTALHRLLGAGSHQVGVVAGLPVEVMADRERAVATLRGLRSWMVGRHIFAVSGTPLTVEVADVQAIAQPAGAFFAWGLNDTGKWARNSTDLRAPVAICDIGFVTLDLFTVQGAEVIGRFTGGDTVGMRRAAEVIVQAVDAQYGVSLSLNEADALLRDRQPKLYTVQGEVNLQPLVRQALDVTAAAVVTFLERRWGNGRQFAYLLFTGGGAEALRSTLLDQYPHAVVLPAPVTANAVGLARYALRTYHR